MSKISDSILENLLEGTTDYSSVTLSVEQHNELEIICDRWVDVESIETETNRYLLQLGYTYNSDKFEWEI